MQHTAGILWIYSTVKAARFSLVSRHVFFSKEVAVKVAHDKIVFTHVGIDYEGHKRKFYMDCYNRYGTTISNVDLPVGKYHFDEDESNEDTLTFYFS
jgi:hypothetical protein